MSLTVNIEPATALVGNPILVKVKSKNEPSIKMVIAANGITLYQATAVPDNNGLCTFSINDIFLNLFNRNRIENDGSLLKELPGSLLEYSVIITGRTTRLVVPGKCYPGGISHRLMRYLSAQGTDIFTAKFCNPRTNFLLSTRTNGSLIAMRETEIGPLYCIGIGLPIVISDLHGHSYTLTPPADGKIYAINIPEIRRLFFLQGTLASYFSISVRNKVIAVVIITPGNENSLILMFRNSLGMYEKIELSGVINIQPEIKKQDIVLKYDYLTNDFSKTTERSGYTPVLSVESGYKTNEELGFIQELLLSDDIYLVNGDELIRVMVSSTKMKYKRPMTDPTSIEIKITFCDDEHYGLTIAEYINAILVNKANVPITTANRKIIINKYFNNDEI